MLWGDYINTADDDDESEIEISSLNFKYKMGLILLFTQNSVDLYFLCGSFEDNVSKEECIE